MIFALLRRLVELLETDEHPELQRRRRSTVFLYANGPLGEATIWHYELRRPWAERITWRLENDLVVDGMVVMENSTGIVLKTHRFSGTYHLPAGSEFKLHIEVFI